MYLKCEINIDSYPHDYPVVTVKLDEEMYSMVFEDFPETERKKELKTFQKNLDKVLEKLKVFERNQSVFHKDDEDTQHFFSVEGVYNKKIDDSEMEEEGSNSCEIEQVVPYLCHI